MNRFSERMLRSARLKQKRQLRAGRRSSRARRFFKFKATPAETRFLNDVVDFSEAMLGKHRFKIGKDIVEVACSQRQHFIDWLSWNLRQSDRRNSGYDPTDAGSEAGPKDRSLLRSMIKKAKMAPCLVSRRSVRS